MEGVTIEISKSPLNIERAYISVKKAIHGAIDLFIGAVRNTHDGKTVVGITYDIHESLAQKVFYEICKEVQALWPGTYCYVAHYHGYLQVGGISTVIAVSTPSRGASFEGCRYILEELKKRAPIWKQEHYENEESIWLSGVSLQSIS